MKSSYLFGLSTAAALTLLIGSVTAQQPPPQQPAPTTPPAESQAQRPASGQPPAPRAAMPAAASSIAAKPEAFYGQYVSIYATVEKSLAPLAFTVDQDKTKSTGQEVIVFAPRLHSPVELNTYVTVMGEVVRPDAAEIAKEAKWANGVAEILAQNPGKPVILASSVLTPALTDLAKFQPPPMTPEEATLDSTMKGVGAANGALRKGIEATNIEVIKTNTTILTKSFADVETFWKGRHKDDAVKMAQTARVAAQSIETAAANSNWGDVKTHATTLAQQCSSCHGIYRERLEDGSFAIKRESR